MGKTTKEATRLVYVEGIDLQNALQLSSDYPNIIFLTDDNIKSHELKSKEIDEIALQQEEGMYTNDNWDLGLNIVRNGHRYIVVRGVNNEHSTFTADGTKYTLRIDQHGLLYLDTNEINERFIYIGKRPFSVDGTNTFLFDIKSIKDSIENGTVDEHENIVKVFKISQTTKETGNKVEILKFMYLVVLKQEITKTNDRGEQYIEDDIYGYLWLFSDVQTLRDAVTYYSESHGTVVGPYSNQNVQSWASDTSVETDDKSKTTTITSNPIVSSINDMEKYLSDYGLTSVFGIDMNNYDTEESDFWNNENVEEMFMILPVSYEDTIIVTNTLRSNRDEESSNMLNNHLIYPFELQYYKKEFQNPMVIDYNKSQYNIYQFEDYRIRSLGFTMRTAK